MKGTLASISIKEWPTYTWYAFRILVSIWNVFFSTFLVAVALVFVSAKLCNSRWMSRLSDWSKMGVKKNNCSALHWCCQGFYQQLIALAKATKTFNICEAAAPFNLPPSVSDQSVYSLHISILFWVPNFNVSWLLMFYVKAQPCNADLESNQLISKPSCLCVEALEMYSKCIYYTSSSVW